MRGLSLMRHGTEGRGQCPGNRVSDAVEFTYADERSGGSLSIVSGAYADNPEVPLVLGAHIVSPIASDLIAEAEQLVGNHVPLHDAAA